MYTGGRCDSMVRTCTGEVCVRSSRSPITGAAPAAPPRPACSLAALAPPSSSPARADEPPSPAPAPGGRQVAVRSSMKKVSSTERAGWSSGVFSAVKL